METEKQSKIDKRRKEWLIEQELNRKHNQRKLKMIEEYEKKRARILHDKSMQNSPEAGTSMNLQQKNNDNKYNDNKHSEKLKESRIEIIEEKDLHKIRVKISGKNPVYFSHNENTSKDQINMDVINPEDIIIPRRNDEGFSPIFKRKEIEEGWKKFEKCNERTVMFVQDDKLEHHLDKSVSRSKEISDVCSRSSGERIGYDYRLHSKVIKHEDDAHNKYRSDSRNSSDDIKNQDRKSGRSFHRRSRTPVEMVNVKEKEDKYYCGYHHMPMEYPAYNAYHPPRMMCREPYNYWARGYYLYNIPIPSIPPPIWRPRSPRFIHNKDDRVNQARKTNEPSSTDEQK